MRLSLNKFGLAANRADTRCPLPTWARRLGLFGFLFFLVKGLLWLLVPALAGLWIAE
ncbi:MAG: hypothetical protein IT432_07755 [Phycisphaerales bacterium]|nr:hypothetical protein [Phycisphaerales bacterium]